MTSEEDHRSRLNIIIGRLRAAIYTTNNTNSKIAFLLAMVLTTLILYSSTSSSYATSSSSSSFKRYGLGAGDNTTGELKAALRRKGDGRAAVAIIRVIGMNNGDVTTTDSNSNNHAPIQYLVQVKSHDYPIEAFRGAVSLLGGNANPMDKTPLDTLKRELNEELHFPEWVNDIDATKIIDDAKLQLSDKPLVYDPEEVDSSEENDPPPRPTLTPGTIRYLGATLHFQSSELMNLPNPYAFLCGLYEITLSPEQLPPSVINPRGANIQEGRLVLLTEDQLIQHSKFAWGYEYTIERYFGKGGAAVHKMVGAAVSVVDENTWNKLTWTPSK